MGTNRKESHLPCPCVPVLILIHLRWWNKICLSYLQHRTADSTDVGFCLCMCLFCFFFLEGCIKYSPAKSYKETKKFATNRSDIGEANALMLNVGYELEILNQMAFGHLFLVWQCSHISSLYRLLSKFKVVHRQTCFKNRVSQFYTSYSFPYVQQSETQTIFQERK